MEAIIGLDMYLSAKRYFWNDEEKPKIDGHDVKIVVAEAAYWRKANQIHEWFVNNIQNGEDECREHDVSRGELTILRDLCQHVIDNPERAEALLPSASGFFFGNTDYDEWYFQDLRHTVTALNKVLAEFDPENWFFTYRSSW